jgi:hypothetical protein
MKKPNGQEWRFYYPTTEHSVDAIGEGAGSLQELL